MQRRTLRTKLLLCSSLFSMASQVITTATLAASPLGTNDLNTTTPIKHVIVIYGENRSFDHLFATYSPKPGETVNNLLSQGIVNADGTPGPNFSKAAQYQATDTDDLCDRADQNRSLCGSASADGRRSQGKQRHRPAVQHDLRSRIRNERPAAARSALAVDRCDRPQVGNPRHPPRQRRHIAQWSLLVDPWHSLQRLCGQPGAPLLPDVPTAGLRR